MNFRSPFQADEPSDLDKISWTLLCRMVFPIAKSVAEDTKIATIWKCQGRAASVFQTAGFATHSACLATHSACLGILRVRRGRDHAADSAVAQIGTNLNDKAPEEPVNEAHRDAEWAVRDQQHC
jgi:hypothetical protein